MSSASKKGIKLADNTILFCEKPWKIPAMALTALVALTFAWGFYILDTYREGYIDDVEDLSVTEFLFRNTATPDVQQLYSMVSPAVVGIAGRGVNGTTVSSGAILSSSGYVMTTLHSVANLTDIDVLVKTATGMKRYPAQIVKSQPAHDLVLLKMLTNDRFLYFKLADPNATAAGMPVFGFGQSGNGQTVVKQGAVQSTNMALTAGNMNISHLLGTDAIYSWEQNGGPLVNVRGELVAIGVALASPSGRVEGFAVPAQVIMAHFQDVVNFNQPQPVNFAAAAGAAQPVQAAATISNNGATGPQAVQGTTGGASSWWAMARQQLVQSQGGQTAATPGAMGLNVAFVAAAPDPIIPADTEHLLSGRIGGYHIADIIGLALLGLAAGVTGGMMTMGGGILQVAGMMAIFGYGMYLIRPVAYLTNVFVYGGAALRNNKSGLVMSEKVKSLAPWAVLGVIGGYFIGNTLGDHAIATLLGAFALVMAAKGLHEIFGPHIDEILVRGDDDGDLLDEDADTILDDLLEGEDRSRNERADKAAALVKNGLLGTPMGLVSGILGISGGVVEVPLQRFFGGLSLQNAIATSSVLVFWASLAGAIVSFAHGTAAGLIEWQAPLVLAAIMIPGAYVGGRLGARLMKVLPVITLKWFYTIVMTAIAVKLLLLK
ncbi:MAG: TSUP family transporter [Alphaproteobacteria bacterium]|nr:TSUP family transporter [Alphaproteobacteria bacterium]MBF0250896.1 TSUP family transporter [Alphaproteobacteria bacterium]